MCEEDRVFSFSARATMNECATRIATEIKHRSPKKVVLERLNIIIKNINDLISLICSCHKK